MEKFETIKDLCNVNSKMFSLIVEDYLFKNVVNHKKMAPEVNARFTPYRHIIQNFPQEWSNRLQMQYVVHTIFKKDGLINSYLKHSAVQRLTPGEQDYLQQLASTPWKFSFSIILSRPAEHFFEMEDVFTEEKYLLYSPGMTDILKTQSIMLWFNLIGYNGACWQSYGPMAAYKSFQPDDIFFFATEQNPNITNESDLMEDVQKNPVPYMMLLSGSAYPATYHKDDHLVQVIAVHDINSFDTKGLDKYFRIEYNSNVYRLALKRWSEHPHFASAFYDEKAKMLMLHSMTDRGFNQLVNRLNELGYDFPPEPEIHLGLSMIITMEKILKKKLVLNPYEPLFTKKQPDEDDENLNKINNLFALAIPEINEGRTPDIKLLSQKTGMDEEAIRNVLKQLKGKLE